MVKDRVSYEEILDRKIAKINVTCLSREQKRGRCLLSQLQNCRTTRPWNTFKRHLPGLCGAGAVMMLDPTHADILDLKEVIKAVFGPFPAEA